MSVESGWNWTQARERAALLVAEDARPDREIAAEVGVSERTLERWKQRPEFVARVAAHVEAFRQAVLTQGIADRVNRVQRLDADWDALRVVQKRRAEAALLAALVRREKVREESPELAEAELEHFEEYPGMMTGRIVRVETPTKMGMKLEYQVDTGLQSELRALEMQAARELGQWIDRSESTVHDNSAVESLQRKLDSLAARIGTAPVPEPTDGSGSD